VFEINENQALKKTIKTIPFESIGRKKKKHGNGTQTIIFQFDLAEHINFSRGDDHCNFISDDELNGEFTICSLQKINTNLFHNSSRQWKTKYKKCFLAHLCKIKLLKNVRKFKTGNSYYRANVDKRFPIKGFFFAILKLNFVDK